MPDKRRDRDHRGLRLLVQYLPLEVLPAVATFLLIRATEAVHMADLQIDSSASPSALWQ